MIDVVEFDDTQQMEEVVMMSIYEDRFDDVTIWILGNALLDPVEECLGACLYGDSVDDSVGDNVI